MPTPKLTTEYRQKKKNNSEMLQSWLSYRWLLKEDIRNGDDFRLNGRLEHMKIEATIIGVSVSYRDEFVEQHMKELIEEVEREKHREGA